MICLGSCLIRTISTNGKLLNLLVDTIAKCVYRPQIWIDTQEQQLISKLQSITQPLSFLWILIYFPLFFFGRHICLPVPIKNDCFDQERP